MMHGWQSESTDEPKGGWSCACWGGCNGCSGHLTHNSWMSVVYCSSCSCSRSCGCSCCCCCCCCCSGVDVLEIVMLWL